MVPLGEIFQYLLTGLSPGGIHAMVALCLFIMGETTRPISGTNAACMSRVPADSFLFR